MKDLREYLKYIKIAIHVDKHEKESDAAVMSSKYNNLVEGDY